MESDDVYDARAQVDYDEVRRRMTAPAWRRLGQSLAMALEADSAVETTALDEVAAALERHLTEAFCDDLVWPWEDGWNEEIAEVAGAFLVSHEAVEELWASDEELTSLVSRLAPLAGFPTTEEIEAGFDAAREQEAFGWAPAGIVARAATIAHQAFAPVSMTATSAPPGDAARSTTLCSACGEPMELFVHLDLSRLPAALDYPHREGWVRLMLCASFCDGGSPCGEPPPQELVYEAQSEPAREPRWTFETLASLGPEAPHPQDFWFVAGLREDYLKLGEAGWREVEEELEQQGLAPRLVDKVGGWPRWCDSGGGDTPTCCGEPMRLLLQLDLSGHGRTGCIYSWLSHAETPAGLESVGCLFQCADQAAHLELLFNSNIENLL